ncbi:MAG: type II toxin-antitoxin system RelE/ParE family toxin [Caldilineaceae bacterium]|nr:type II toxin-antitoxin system RelE/ParE family toxin [Caldilineaceae bacterium]MDE0631771.1 type II toxin-antitoxin system RelE/ParE family toxin [Caldilineaceae bacterium]
MFKIIESATFRRWLHRLRDRRAVARINARLRNVTLGYFGDVKSVGGGIFEMRIHYGPGYRLYYIRDGAEIVVLLCGGQKDTQSRDIERARQLAEDWG